MQRAALRYISRSDHTEYEVRNNLLSKDYPEEAVDQAIDFLKENNYINDRRYAEYYVVCYKDRRSSARIWMDLQRKGVDEQIISESMETVDMSSSEAAVKAVKKHLVRKNITINDIDYNESCKLFAALSRQGFSFDEIKQAMRTIEENDE